MQIDITMEKKKILLTGANGFIGKYFIANHANEFQFITPKVRFNTAENIDMTGVDVLIHLAGKAHEMGVIDERIYYEANFELTKILAVKAKKSGVSQFIYFSSSKVFGEGGELVYNVDSACNPGDPYGKSKLMAEDFLRSVADEHFTVTIIRPPLVYGPGVKGNMINLLKLCARDAWLPFKAIENKRSMVYLGNLTALTIFCMQHKIEGIVLPGDAELVSTSDLIITIKKHMNLKNKLFSIPLLLRTMMKWTKPKLYQRLFGSFVVNSKDSNNKIQFVPPFTFDEGIKETVNWYKGNVNEPSI
ncbi:MAG: NAD-dependent epimerase/dehydratase family protein [Bacteroidetes bacterium]|nr:NAD-dependent epimerase/dehydratase family protein [Bacteroidota bacterium]